MIPEVYEKTGKSMVSPQLSGYTTVTIPLLNSLSLANHDMRRHEKDLVLCLMRSLARGVEVLRQFDFPLKGRSELFEPRRGEF